VSITQAAYGSEMIIGGGCTMKKFKRGLLRQIGHGELINGWQLAHIHPKRIWANQLETLRLELFPKDVYVCAQPLHFTEGF